MQDLNNLCFGCMKELKDNRKPCPYCGFDSGSHEQNPRCLSLGTILAGRYLVGKVLGEGGFGIVYLGLDLNLQVKVAIKEYFPMLAASRDITTAEGNRVCILDKSKKTDYEKGMKKYIHEAQNLSKFDQVPEILSIKEFFYENETAYIVMDYLEGVTLTEYLRAHGGSLSEEETLSLMKPLIQALEKVHETGMIHRDISPDNIMILKNNRLGLLIDFGAALMTEESDPKTRTLVLKAGYAPEEQYRTNGEQGPWTDVYALCATMYEMLTGTRPLPSTDRILQDQLPDFQSLPISVSRQTERAIRKGLSVKKEQRIQNMMELQEALYGNGIPDESRNRNFLYAGIGIACILALLGAVFGMHLLKRSSGSKQLSTEIAIEKQTNTEEKLETVKIEEQKPEPEIGEQMVFPSLKTSVAVGWDHLLVLQADGTVQAAGDGKYRKCQVEEWEHIAAVAAGAEHSLGLRTDGTVLATGDNRYGQCDVRHWKDVVAIAAGDSHSMGLKKDGTVLVTGSNNQGQSELEGWSDVEKIYGAGALSFGIRKDGTVLMAGFESGKDQTGEWSVDSSQVENWTEIEEIRSGGGIVLGIRKDGSLVYAGTTQSSYWNFIAQKLQKQKDIKNIQLVSYIGLAATLYEDGSVGFRANLDDEEIAFPDWKQMAEIYGGKNFLAGLREDGTVLVVSALYDGDIDLKAADSISQACASPYLVGALSADGHLRKYGMYIDDNPAMSQEKLTEICTDTHFVFGKNEEGQLFCQLKMLQDRIDSLNSPEIVQIVTNGNQFFTLMRDGTVKEISYFDVAPGTEEYMLVHTEDWEHIVKLDTSSSLTAGLKEDGTVLFGGFYKEEFEKLTEDWRDIQDISVAYSAIAGVRADGTVAYAGELDYGQGNVHDWSDIVQVEVSNEHTVGLKADGTVVAVGQNQNGQCNVEDWTQVQKIIVPKYGSITLGITADGRLLTAGNLTGDWENIELPKTDILNILESEQ